MRVTSKSFVTGIMTKNGLDPDITYHVEGVYSEKNNAVIFNLKDAQIYSPKKKEA